MKKDIFHKDKASDNVAIWFSLVLFVLYFLMWILK